MNKINFDHYLEELQSLPKVAQKEIFHFVEYLFYEAIYNNFPVLIHKFNITEEYVSENKNIEELDYEQLIIWLIHIPREEFEKTKNLIKFLKIKHSNKHVSEDFQTFCDASLELSDDEKQELQRRIKDIEDNPDIGIPWEDVVKNLKFKVGKKVKLSS